MDKNRKNVVNIVVISLAGIVILSSVLMMFYLNNWSPSAEQIYADNICSVVELKATSENIGESFGTAVIINSNGTLVTNAHVVTYKKLDTTMLFESYEIRFADEEQYRRVSIVEYDLNLDIRLLR